MKKTLPFLFLSFSLFSFSQQKLWKGYFSYNEITDVCISTNKVCASTKNSIFDKDVSTNILTTFTSVNDVKSDEITAVFQTSLRSRPTVLSATKDSVGRATSPFLLRRRVSTSI